MRLSSSNERTHPARDPGRATATLPSAGAGLAPRPSAVGAVTSWDEIDGDDEQGGLSPEALQEWYRYIDSLTRTPGGAIQEPRGEFALDIEAPDAPPAIRGSELAAPDPIPSDSRAPIAERTGGGPPYLDWGQPWTPPEPEEVDPASAEQIVAELATEPAAGPSVAWESAVSDVSVPEFESFVSALDSPPASPPLAPSPIPEPVVTTTALVRVPQPPGAEQQQTSPTRPERTRREPMTSAPAVATTPPPAPPRQPAEESPARSPASPERRAPASPLPSIGEIRQRLPEHMERLLQVPTTEVAQHSYKCEFKETREALIQRLLDPSLTLEETARLLGVCPTTVRRYTNRGLLHHFRTTGNQRRFRMSDVLAFLDEHGGTWRLSDEADPPQTDPSRAGAADDGRAAARA